MKPKQYLVTNPLVSVRVSTDRESPDYERFVDWKAGEVMTEWPPHTDIRGLLAMGAIELAKGER